MSFQRKPTKCVRRSVCLSKKSCPPKRLPSSSVSRATRWYGKSSSEKPTLATSVYLVKSIVVFTSRLSALTAGKKLKTNLRREAFTTAIPTICCLAWSLVASVAAKCVIKNGIRMELVSWFATPPTNPTTKPSPTW